MAVLDTSLDKFVVEAAQQAAHRQKEVERTVADLWEQVAPLKYADVGDRVLAARSHQWAGAVPGDVPVGTFSACTDEDVVGVVGIDGSQIYPSIDVPFMWGYVRAVAYRMSEKPLMLSSFLAESELHKGGTPRAITDAARTLIESDMMLHAHNTWTGDKLVLMDNPLLPFFHEVGGSYLKVYLQNMEAMLDDKVMVAGVVSEPRSQLLIALLRLYSGKDDLPDIKDVSFMRHALGDGQRTAVYMHGTPRNDHFIDKGMGVYFFFVRIGDAILRVEVPEWIANDEASIETVHNSIARDSKIGYSYTLSRAHQAVVVVRQEEERYQNLAMAEYIRNGGKPMRPRIKDEVKK